VILWPDSRRGQRLRSDAIPRIAKLWPWGVRSVIFIIVRLPVCVLIRAVRR
jgi:hypothetical protein